FTPWPEYGEHRGRSGFARNTVSPFERTKPCSTRPWRAPETDPRNDHQPYEQYRDGDRLRQGRNKTVARELRDPCSTRKGGAYGRGLDRSAGSGEIPLCDQTDRWQPWAWSNDRCAFGGRSKSRFPQSQGDQPQRDR